MKLHLGCGKRFIPGFVHVDLANFSHIDYRCDVRQLPMFLDETADLIYACHVLEYFDRIEAVDVLKEWRRVLKTGGILRLAVPDLWALMNVYDHTGDESLIIGPLYGRMEIGATIIYHKTVYDVCALGNILKLAGFQDFDIRYWDWRTTEHAAVDDFSQAYIPHMDKLNGVLISLNMEATK